MKTLPRIGLILTGGTIDSVGTDRLDLAWYMEAGKRLGDGELLAQVPELAKIASVQEIPFRRLPSHALIDKDWLELVRRIHAILDQDQADGIVVTHGTNTLEETAYFLNLTLKTEKPVVIVGSMRPSSAISADGYLNIINAVRVAVDPSSRGRGCLVVMNDTIFNGRDVTKTSTYRVQAFQSRDMGPLGFADADAALDAAAGEPHGEPERVVIAAILDHAGAASDFHHRRASELGPADHERILQQPA